MDDGSVDGTRSILLKNKRYILHLILHKKNIGKGGAIKTAKNLLKIL